MKVKHIILLLVIYLLSGFTGAGAAEVGDINIHGFISHRSNPFLYHPQGYSIFKVTTVNMTPLHGLI